MPDWFSAFHPLSTWLQQSTAGITVQDDPNVVQGQSDLRINPTGTFGSYVFGSYATVPFVPLPGTPRRELSEELGVRYVLVQYYRDAGYYTCTLLTSEQLKGRLDIWEHPDGNTVTKVIKIDFREEKSNADEK